MTVEELTAAIDRTHPNLIDPFEAAAVVESLGYSDRRVAESFGLPSTLALGRHVHRAQLGRPHAPVPSGVRSNTGEPALVQAATSSLVYAVPWLLVFLVESRDPGFLHLAPALAAPLTLALMASLVVSGGFVQAIARRAQFCIAIDQIALARLTCRHLMLVGLSVSGVIAAAALLLGWYFSLFSTSRLILAGLYFVVASALWMHCAVLAVARQSWRIPLVFAVGGITFSAFRMLNVGTLAAQAGALITALVCAFVQSQHVFASDRRPDADVRRGVHPWIVAHGLVPSFLYGVLYFTFLVADRVAVGAAVASRGLPFGIPNAYKDGMDVALLTFLLAAAAVECCNVMLMRGWRAIGVLAADEGFASGPSHLRRRWCAVTAALITAFLCMAWLVFVVAEPLTERSMQGMTRTILIVGDVGYLIFAMGLLNALALSSLDRMEAAARALATGVVVNLVVGILLGHLLSPHYAAAGLPAGAAVFAMLTSRKLSRLLRHAGTAYATV